MHPIVSEQLARDRVAALHEEAAVARAVAAARLLDRRTPRRTLAARRAVAATLVALAGRLDPPGCRTTARTS